MAQTDNTNSTKKEIRKYTRGRDNVDLDAWLSNVSSGWNDFKKEAIGREYTINNKKVKITKEDLSKLDQAYDILFSRLNSGDNSLIYNYDKANHGFRDQTGALNGQYNVYLGIAANHFGDKLREMSIYSDPVDPSKIEYGEGAMGKILTKRLLGSTGTVQDFIDRDKYDKSTRTRGNTVRSKDLKDLLSTTVADLRSGVKEFSNWTQEQREKEATNLERLFTVFTNDGQITDDEYLKLAKGTGMSNLRELFATGEQTAPTVVSPDGTVQKSGRTFADFIRWIPTSEYKPYTGTLMAPVSIVDSNTKPYAYELTAPLDQALKNSTAKELQDLLTRVIGVDDYDINQDEYIKKLYPNGRSQFSTPYILNKVLKALQSKQDGLYNFGEASLGDFYIPGTRTDRNTGFVWNNTNNTIREVSIHDIPYWQDIIFNKWYNSGDEDTSGLNQSLVQSYNAKRFKKGGILKAYNGTRMNRNNGRGPGITGKNPWLAISDTLGDPTNTETWDDYYYNDQIDNNIKQALNWKQRPTNLPAPKLSNDDPNASLVRQLNYTDLQNGNYSQAQLDAYLDNTYGPKDIQKFWEYGYRVDDKGHPIKGEDGKDLHGISASQLGIYLNELNQIGSELSWEKKLNDTNYDKWNRKFDQTGLNIYFGGDSDRFKFIGPSTYNRHELLKRMQSTYTKDNPLTIDGSSIYWNGKRWAMSIPDSKPTIPTHIVSKPDPSTIKIKTLPTDIDEGYRDGDDSSNDKNKLFKAVDVVPELIGAGRLFSSLNANNRISKVLRQSLNPVIKDTYELYSPVTGAFSDMQLKNRQGAETLSQSYRPFTSDASLAAARMLEGQKYANDLQYQGYLANDKEIKRTQAEALSRQENNIARRSDIANFNRASINQTNREIAQLEAARINKNWSSLDNFLKGQQQQWLENRAMRKQIEYDIAESKAKTKAELALEPWKEKVLKYLSDPKNTDITKMPGYTEYKKATKNASRDLETDLNQAKLSLYSTPYSSIRYTRNGGTLIPKSQDFISKIIKLNNERNS